MEDFSVQIRLHNNQLRGRRKELGLTQKQLAKAIGITHQTYGTYECFGYNRPKSNVSKPWNVDTETWSTPALRIAAFHCVEPEELFPIGILSVVKNLFEKKVSKDAAHALISDSQKRNALPPDRQIDERLNLTNALEESMASLGERERFILKERFYSEDIPTLEAVGAKLGVSKERVRHIEAMALRKLRHSSNRGHLEGFISDAPDVSRGESSIATFRHFCRTLDVTGLMRQIERGNFEPHHKYSVDVIVRILLQSPLTLATAVCEELETGQRYKNVRNLLLRLKNHHKYVKLCGRLGSAIEY